MDIPHCGWCRQELAPDAASWLFCSEHCQKRWNSEGDYVLRAITQLTATELNSIGWRYAATTTGATYYAPDQSSLTGEQAKKYEVMVPVEALQPR